MTRRKMVENSRPASMQKEETDYQITITLRTSIINNKTNVKKSAMTRPISNKPATLPQTINNKPNVNKSPMPQPIENKSVSPPPATLQKLQPFLQKKKLNHKI